MNISNRIVRAQNRWTAIVVILILLPSQVSARDALDRVLAELERNVGQIATASWKAEDQKGKIDANGKFVPGVDWCRSLCFFEPPTGRYWVESEQIGERPFDSKAPINAFRSIFAHNGKAYSYIRSNQPGKSLPPRFEESSKVPRGAMVTNHSREFFAGIGKFSGIAYVWPNFSEGRFVDWVRETRRQKRSVHLTESPDCYEFDMESDTGTVYRMRYDRMRGAISACDFLDAKLKKPFIQIKIDFQLMEGVWFPSQITHVGLYNNPSNQTKFSDVVLNRPFPDDRFEIKFPSNTIVSDDVNNRVFRVGANPLVEQKEIQEFLKTAGIAPVVPQSRVFLMVNVAIVIITLLLAIQLGLRYRFGLGRKAAVIAVFALAPSSTFATDTPTEDHFIPQCGYHVSVVALEYFKRPYDANSLFANLKPDGVRGIAMSNVKSVLAERGLRTEVRKQIAQDDLRKSVQRGWLAIVPVEFPGSCVVQDLGPNAGPANHYLVVLNHPKHGVIVVDALRSVQLLAKSGLTDKQLQNPKTAILFVRP